MVEEETRLELMNNLTRLLKNLNFSDIHSEVHHKYPNPDFDHLIIKKLGYSPPIMAKKNGVFYFFEFIDDNPSKLKRIKQPLQKIIELGYERWDADFVLVTKYGNKDRIKEWCEDYDLPVDQIWEM